MARFQVVPFAISTNFGFNLSVKIYAPENPYKNAEFLVGLQRKKTTVKSDKLAIIEGKILNLMFLDIYIPVAPIENWLRATHNQRQKSLKVASVLLLPHILKTKSWLESGSSLLNSRM